MRNERFIYNYVYVKTVGRLGLLLTTVSFFSSFHLGTLKDRGKDHTKTMNKLFSAKSVYE